ncbi:MAG: TnpV protein [Anaerotignum faecicola]
MMKAERKKRQQKKGALHMEVTYRTERGVRIPNLTIPQQEEVFPGKYAQLRKAFLKEHRRAEYTTLKTTCRLTQHLAETEQNAKKMAEQLITKMAQEQKITEEMKEKNPLEWTAAMNNLKHSAEETVLRELIYK